MGNHNCNCYRNNKKKCIDCGDKYCGSCNKNKYQRNIFPSTYHHINDKCCYKSPCQECGKDFIKLFINNGKKTITNGFYCDVCMAIKIINHEAEMCTICHLLVPHKQHYCKCPKCNLTMMRNNDISHILCQSCDLQRYHSHIEYKASDFEYLNIIMAFN